MTPLFAHRRSRRTDGRHAPAAGRPQLVEALEGRVLMDATVTLVKSGPTKVNYIDPDGSNSSISMAGPGSVTIQFGGPALTQTTKGKTVTLTGTALNTTIAATGTTNKTSITITGKGGNNKVANVDGVLVTGDLSALKAKSAAIAGSVGVTGTAGSLTMDSNAGGAVTAQSINKLTVTNVFAGGLTTGSLNNFKAGSIVGGAWAVAGKTSGVTATSITGWTGTFGTLNKLAVKDAMAGSTLRTGGDINTVQVGTLLNSNVYVGIANLAAGTLPASPADFIADAQIKNLKLKNLGVGSNVAASSIKNATLGTVQFVPNPPPFGVAATDIKSLTATVSNKKLKLKNVTDQAEVNNSFTAAGIPLQAFVVLIV